jgi:hypothetical protein
MKTFQVRKDNFEQVLKFENLQAAEAFWINYQPCVITEITPYIRTTQEKVADDLVFGNQLYFEFLVDNETTPATAQEVIGMFVKFGDAKNALLAGAIVQARYIVSLLTVDTLFNQERKDKYLAMMDTYLSQYV